MSANQTTPPSEPDEELVDVYDEAGRAVGRVPRSRMRAENLRHAATMILVRDHGGQVFVHRRTDTKDVYPGLWDFCAGGVVAAGEDPTAGAVRELAEELGIRDAPLHSLGTDTYRDEHADYIAHLFETVHDGPVTLQPEEVATGDWMPLAELKDRLAREPQSFVPDAIALMSRHL